MQAVAFFASLLLLSAAEKSSLSLKKSDVENYNSKLVSSNEKPDVDYKNSSPLELIIDLGNYSQSMVSKKEKKPQRERIRKRKYKREKKKFQKPLDDFTRNILRNNEKTSLLRNKTIETLKSGLKILSAGDSYSQNGKESTSRLNETLLEKILSSSVSKKDILFSAAGVYQLPVGFGIYKRTLLPANHTAVLFPETNIKGHQAKRQNKKHQKSFSEDYDYELVSNLNVDTSNNSTKVNENIQYETADANKTVRILLEQVKHALKNLTNDLKYNCPNKNKKNAEDHCQKWLDCQKTLDRAFTEGIDNLPSCPCTYPSFIFYDEMIWDKNRKKYFRWRDASSEAERLDIYKPGAAYCIRSLLTQGSFSISSQQCCYDRSLQLLTRGSGAGTMNFISPDISKKLHHTVDILPWILCKGDFTRYNVARSPNNGNNCPENPHEEQYQLQVKLSRIF